MIQLTLIQIDNYGPWTTNPAPKKEASLQLLQSKIYSQLQKKFSAKKALLFPMRYDNLIAITNGISEQQHRKIMDAVNKKIPVSISMSIAVGETPYEAQALATKQLSVEGGARHASRKAVLKSSGISRDAIQIAHIDINGITEHTDLNVYDSYSRVVELEKDLIKHLTPKGTLVFYMGGDNFIAPCNGLSEGELQNVLEKVEKETGIRLKAGLGVGMNAEEAVHLASLGLKEIRAGVQKRVVMKNDV
ncbi:MAG: GTP cyclohydrolase IIa [Candidatus Altiarchaeales archaeon]|nr:GTP cyclohydrolase IIa [Candidatus Altiarchaeales archaeon]